MPLKFNFKIIVISLIVILSIIILNSYVNFFGNNDIAQAKVNKRSLINKGAFKKSVVVKKKTTAIPVKSVTLKAIITYDDGLQPNIFTVKVGTPVVLEIIPKEDGDGCMSTILIPELYEKVNWLKAGKKITMKFTPKRIGEYYITCEMGVGWGIIKVIN